MNVTPSLGDVDEEIPDRPPSLAETSDEAHVYEVKEQWQLDPDDDEPFGDLVDFPGDGNPTRGAAANAVSSPRRSVDDSPSKKMDTADQSSIADPSRHSGVGSTCASRTSTGRSLGGAEQVAQSPHSIGNDAPFERWRCAIGLQWFVDLWPVQICFAALVAVNWWGYQAPREDEELHTEHVKAVAYTFLGLFVIIISELLIRIAAQGGPLQHKNSYRRFFSLFFHKFEVFFICIFWYWVWRVVFVPLRQISQGKNITYDYFIDNFFSVCVPAGLRLQRFWGIWFNISVQQEDIRRKARKSKNRFLWRKDYDERIQLRNKEILTRTEIVLNNVIVQFVITIFVLGQSLLYILSRSVEALHRFYWLTKFTGYGLLLAYAFEFTVRCAAQGGFEQFLGPTVHKVEVVNVALGIFFHGRTVWYHDKYASDSSFSWWGFNAGVLLVFHRAVRAFEIHQEVSAADNATDNFMDALARKQFTRFTGIFLKVPPENVFVRIQMPSEVTIHIRKAELNEQAMQGLHLPLAVRGGLVEDLHLTVKASLKGAAEVNVRVENALLLLAPGDGLAEAGGFKPAGSYWNAETVREAKSNLVELMCKHVTPEKEKKEPSDKDKVLAGPDLKSAASSRGVRGWKAATSKFANYRKRMVKTILDSIFKNLTVNIKNVRVQLDDSEGSLGLQDVTIGAKVASIRLERRLGTGSIHRLGVFVQTHGRERASRELGQHHGGGRRSLFGGARPGGRRDPSPVHGRRASQNSVMSEIETAAEAVLKRLRLRKRTLTRGLSSLWQEEPSKYAEKKLHHLLRDHPRDAVAETVRQNHLERWRLWAFEALQAKHREGRQADADKQKHAWLTWFPERHLVFSVLRLECHAAPDRSGKRTARRQTLPQETDEGDSPGMPRAPTVQNQEDDDVFNFHAALLTGQGRSSTAALQEALRGRARQPPKELHKWMWNVDIPEPVRISVNSEQVYAVRTVFSSVKSWNIHANAMKWWPGLRICDLQDYPQKGVVRHTVARMWWLYAVHRIFAQRHRQATNMMVDAMWQGMIFSRYKELLKVMAHTKRQHGGYVPNASLVAFQPYKAEEKQVKDLQLLLPLNDILAARRRAISAHGEKRRTTVHPARAGIIERSKHSWRKQLSRLRSSLQMGQMAPVGDPEDDELDVEDGEVRTSFSQETFQEDSGSLEEDFGRQQSVASTSTMAYRSSVSTTAYSKETRSTFALKHFAGHWEVNVPAVELVALAGNSSRLRLLSGRVANICADVILEVQGQSMGHDAISIPSSPGHPRQATRSVQRASDAAETPQSPPSCLLALSVDSFLLTSPDRLEDSGEGLGRNLLHGAPPEVVRVVRPLRLGEPRSHDIGAARKAGRRIRENTAVAVFAALDLQSGAGGECEVHLPDLGVVVSDLLLERLADFAAGKSVKLRISMSDAADEEEDRDDQAKTSHAHSEEQRWTTYPRHHFDSLMGQVLSFRHIATSSSTATDQASNQRNLVSYASMGSVLSFAETRSETVAPVQSAQSGTGTGSSPRPPRSPRSSQPRSAGTATAGSTSRQSSREGVLASRTVSSLGSVPESTPHGTFKCFKEPTRVYRANATVASMRRNQKLYEKAAKLVGLRRGLDVRYNVGSVHVVMMTEYTATKLCVYQTRIYPLIASETDKDVCDVAGCNVNHKDVEVNLDFNGLAAGRGDDCPPSEIDQDAPSEISLLPSTPAVTPRALVQALSPRIPQWWLLEQAQRRRPEAAAAPRLDRYREVFSSFGASLGCDEPEAPPVVEDLFKDTRPVDMPEKRKHSCDDTFYANMRLGCARPSSPRSQLSTVEVSILPRVPLRAEDGSFETSVAAPRSWVHDAADEWRAELEAATRALDAAADATAEELDGSRRRPSGASSAPSSEASSAYAATQPKHDEATLLSL